MTLLAAAFSTLLYLIIVNVHMYRAMLQSEHGKLDTLRQDYTALQQSVGGLQVLDTLFNVPGADPATLLELVGSRLVAASRESESLRQMQELRSRAKEAAVKSEVIEGQKAPSAPVDPTPSSSAVSDNEANATDTDQRDQLLLLQNRIADLQKQLVDRELSSDLAPLQAERRVEEWEQQRHREREEAAARIQLLQERLHILEMENSRLEQELFTSPIPSKHEPFLRSDGVHTDDKGGALESAKDEVRRLKAIVQERNCQLGILTDTVEALQKSGAQYPSAGAKGGSDSDAKTSWAMKALIER